MFVYFAILILLFPKYTLYEIFLLDLFPSQYTRQR